MNPEKVIDLRSDTITIPTPRMRRAMADAEVGDDARGEDPTVNRLEVMIAERLGHEAAVFTLSGTMSNQASILAHTRPGQEAILEETCHILLSECGDLARIAGVQSRTLRAPDGLLSLHVLEDWVRPTEGRLSPGTGLICLENSHASYGGIALPAEPCRDLCEFARGRDVPVHLDGERVFNAAVALGVPVAELTRHFDSITIGFSKGLCCPLGSAVAGPQEVIERVRKARSILGGGMRQAGVIAAPCILALGEMVDRLAEDHEKARALAEGIHGLDSKMVDLERVQTNIVNLEATRAGLDGVPLLDAMGREGIGALITRPGIIRLVAHKDVSAEDVPYAVEAIGRAMERIGHTCAGH